MRALGPLPAIGSDKFRRGERVGVSAQAAGAVIKATHLRILGHVWAVHGRVEASEEQVQLAAVDCVALADEVVAHAGLGAHARNAVIKVVVLS